MHFTKGALTVGLVLASCLPCAGHARTIPECGEQRVIAGLNTALLRLYERRAATAAGKYLSKDADLRKFFYTPQPKVVYQQNLSGFASVKRDEDTGQNHCSAANKSELAVELRFKINPHYGGDEKDLLADVIGALAAQGENAMAEGSDGIVVIAKLPVPDTIRYAAQFSDKGDGVIVRVDVE